MKRMLPALAGLALAACGSGISGDYGGEKCFFNKLAFQDDGKVYVTFMGMERAGTYTVDGDKVSITMPDGTNTVFTRNGDILEAGMLGDKMECGPI